MNESFGPTEERVFVSAHLSFPKRLAGLHAGGIRNLQRSPSSHGGPERAGPDGAAHQRGLVLCQRASERKAKVGGCFLKPKNKLSQISRDQAPFNVLSVRFSA